jgi:hypothetical protein
VPLKLRQRLASSSLVVGSCAAQKLASPDTMAKISLIEGRHPEKRQMFRGRAQFTAGIATLRLARYS